MKNLGIVRKMDVLGRIVIPKEIRDKYELEKGIELEINTSENGDVVLRKYKDTYCPQCLTRCKHTDNFCSECGLNFNKIWKQLKKQIDGEENGCERFNE